MLKSTEVDWKANEWQLLQPKHHSQAVLWLKTHLLHMLCNPTAVRSLRFCRVTNTADRDRRSVLTVALCNNQRVSALDSPLLSESDEVKQIVQGSCGSIFRVSVDCP